MNMHIVIVTRALPFHQIGGMEVITWDLARAFALQGIKVSCLTTRIKGKPEQFCIDNVNVIALKKCKPSAYSSQWWKESRKYFEQFFIGKCDVVLSVSAAAFGIVALRKACPDTKFVFQAHGTSLSEILSKFRLRTIKSILSSVVNMKWLPIDLYKYRNFDGFVASGHRVYKDLNGKFYQAFIGNKHLEYLPNGIFISDFYPNNATREMIRQKLDIKPECKVYLLASRLTKQKGVRQALDGLAVLRDKGNEFKVIVLGNGPEEENLKEHVNTLALANSVKFIGPVSIQELPDYLNASDLYIFSTLHEEGLPLLPLEALATGLPVIASEHLAEINGLSDKVIGVNPRDPEAIAKAIADVERKHLLNQRDNFLPEAYSMEGVVKEYLRFFKSI